MQQGRQSRSSRASRCAQSREINAIFWKLDLGNSEDVSRLVKAAVLYLAG
jgi:hypothetical protein